MDCRVVSGVAVKFFRGQEGIGRQVPFRSLTYPGFSLRLPMKNGTVLELLCEGVVGGLPSARVPPGTDVTEPDESDPPERLWVPHPDRGTSVRTEVGFRKDSTTQDRDRCV